MKKKIIILILFAIILNSCLDRLLGHKYEASVENAKINFENCYSVNGLFDHFPKSISNNSFIDMLARIPSNVYYSDSYHTGFFYLTLRMGESSQTLYPKSYLYRTLYSNRNFIIDDAFSYYKYTDTLKLRNVFIPDAFPIPYFEDFDFGLGSEEFDLRCKGIELVVDKYYVPNDLEVFVIKAKNGFFWKMKADWERPETLGVWKNGYSCGIALSQQRNMIIYWVKAW